MIKGRLIRIVGIIMISFLMIGNICTFSTSAEEAYSERVSDSSTENDWKEYAEKSTQYIGRIWTDKSVYTDSVTLTSSDMSKNITIQKPESSNFLIGLSALSSSSSLSVKNSTPLNVILVLDQSGSMDDDFDGNNTRQKAMLEAVDSFVESLHEDSKKNLNDHNLGIVTYGSRSDVLVPLESIEENYQSIKDQLNNLDPNGATSTDEGMQEAYNMLSSDSGEYKNIVILFTDGVPTYLDFFSNSVANDTIDYAYQLKNNRSATVYTIGIVPGADPTFIGNVNDRWSNVLEFDGYSEEQKVNRFLNLVSNNTLTADSLGIELRGLIDGWFVNTNFDYTNNGYYKSASNSDDLKDIFNEISDDIIEPSSPTYIEEGYDASKSGYITFEDRLGDYMEVDDVVSIVFAGQQFKTKNATTSGNTTTYTFTGTVPPSDIYPEGSLSDVIIEVTKETGKAGDKITVRIPASLIPLRYFDVSVEEDSTAAMNVKEAYPIRIYYGVSMKDDTYTNITKGIFDNDLENYINTNKINNEVAFYSNSFTKGNDNGNTTATFTPSMSNKFYYFVENTPLYTDENCTTPATTFTSGTTYYYRNDYYKLSGTTGTLETSYEVATNLSSNNVTTIDGQLHVLEGTRKVTIPGNIAYKKAQNETGTASYVLNPISIDSDIEVSLGNNGRLLLDVDGNVIVSKTVRAEQGFNLPDDYRNEVFNFTLKVTNTSESSFTAFKGDEEITIDNNGTFILKDGESIRIVLPDDANYSITEGDNPTYKADNNVKSGTVVGGTSQEVDFINTYYPEPVQLSSADIFKVRKDFSGRKPSSSDVYSFVVTRQGPMSGPMPEKTQLDITMKESQEENDVYSSDIQEFNGNLVFDRIGTYHYFVSEEEGNIPGVNYTTDYYEVIVDVEVDETNTNKLKADVSYILHKGNDSQESYDYTQQGAMIFSNTFSSTDVTFHLAGRKTLENKRLDKGMFEFELVSAIEEGSNNQAPLPSLVQNVGDKVKNGASSSTNERSIYFGSLVFGTEDIGKTYVYTIKEVIPSTTNGITYDEDEKVIKIEVGYDSVNGATVTVLRISDDKNNHITTYPYFEFNNTYSTSPASVNLDIQKTMSGRKFLANESFRFEIHSPTENAPKFNDVTITAEGNESVISAKTGLIEFVTPGSYIYEIKEVKGDNAGISYDEHTSVVTVKITDDGHGQLTSTVTYNNSSSANESDKLVTNKASFTNTYAASGTARIEVEKIIDGRQWNSSDSFKFILNNKGNNIDDITLPESNEITIDFNTPEHKASFEDITFHKAGTYTFEVHELEGTIPNLDYDSEHKEITFNVTDDGSGTLTVDPSIQKVSFTNTYTPSPVTLNGQENLRVQKILSGKDAWTEGEYSFTIENISKPDSVGVAPMPANTTITIQAPATGLSNTANFGDISFTTPGTYEYLIKEVEETNSNIKYSKAEYKVSVIVTYDENRGRLNAQSTIARIKDTEGNESSSTTTIMSFENAYIPNPYTLDSSISFKKILNGRDFLDTDRFIFTIRSREGTPLPQNASVEVSNANTNNFGSITFTQAGTYYYQLNEEIGSIPGISYSKEEYIAVINIIDNSGSLDLRSLKYYKVNETGDEFVELGEGEIPTFTNTYNSSLVWDTSATFNVHKNYINVGEGNIDAWTDESSFEFVMAAGQDTIEAINRGDIVMGENLQNTKSMTINSTTANYTNSFGNITINKAGIYTFTVKEIEGDAYGVSYDPSRYQIIITVNDNNDGTLAVTETSISKLVSEQYVDVQGNTLEFTNEYNLPIARDVINGHKTLNGKTLKDSEFTFMLSASGEGEVLERSKEVLGGDSKTTVNSGDGSFNFSLDFVNEGTYKFKLSEVNDAKQGYTYDSKEYVIEYLVSYDENIESLVYTRTIDGVSDMNSTLSFTNSYKASPVTISNQIIAKKVLTGKPLSAGEFTFLLTSIDNQDIVYTATNDVLGNIVFGDIVYDATGVYEYILSERNDAKDGYTYDDTSYLVRVNVTDEGGKLSAQVSYMSDKGPINAEEAVFNNSYKASPVNVMVHANKYLENRDLKDKEFTFELYKEDELISTATNDINGDIVFDLGTYDEIPSGTVAYTIKERKGSDSNITYDASEYQIKVSISDNDFDGYLEATILVDDSLDKKIEFTNIYNEPEKPTTPTTPDKPDYEVVNTSAK